MITIRNFITTDTDTVKHIMTLCTSELRAVYKPKPKSETILTSHSLSNTRVVAVDDADTVIGVAEYITQEVDLYIQGVAVLPTHRRRGVARTLLGHIATLAIDFGLPALSVVTIKETGNVEIFESLGFIVVEERTSDRFVGIQGQPVTELVTKKRLPLNMRADLSVFIST